MTRRVLTYSTSAPNGLLIIVYKIRKNGQHKANGQINIKGFHLGQQISSEVHTYTP